ncbi:MAG: tetratricopeptide repeat protein [Tepidisphaeraceae bacterium]|jgi:tetratricopeptide (TPR) repeat protein
MSQSAVSAKPRDHPAPSRFRGWRKWAMRLLLLVASPVVCVLLLEALLWVCGYGRPTAYLLLDSGTGCWTRNDQFTWQFAPPRAAPSGDQLRIPDSKPPGTFRIFIIGESAAMGTPDGSYSFGRMLESMLRSRYPNRRFEVHTAAMTAINSHVLLPLARDCAARQPDLCILYIGNNEVTGPFGPSTVFKSFSPNLGLIRAGIFVRSTRTGQWLSSLLSRDGKNGAGPIEWKGMATFATGIIPASDPRRQGIYAHYRRNLEDIVAACHGGGARVMLCTVGVNLQDSPPFASLHRVGLSDAELKQWQAAVDRGIAAEKVSETDKAIAQYRAAIEIDNQYAELHYRLGRVLLVKNDVASAERGFQLAVDLDALQFRTDSRQNGIVREVAESTAATLVDIEQAIRSDVIFGQKIPGDRLFWEHVHYRFEGNWLVARTLLERIEPVLQAGPGSGVVPDPQSVRAALALTPYDERRMAASMAEMMSRAPFAGQLEHTERVARVRTKLKDIVVDASGVEASIKAYEAAISLRPEDWRLRVNFAMLLESAGEIEKAIEQAQAASRLLPGDSDIRFLVAGYEALSGKSAAADELRLLAARHPYSPGPLKSLATLHARQKDYKQAAEFYGKALELRPTDALLHANLGAMLMALDDPAGAREHLQRAIDLDDNAESHHSMSLLLRNEKKYAEAAEHLRKAVEREPSNPKYRNNLAGYLLQTGKEEEAMAELRAAIQSDPRHGKSQALLGQLLLARRQWREGAEHLRLGVENGADTPGNLIALSWLLATAPSGAIRDGAAAVQLAEKACRLTDQKDYSALEALAAAQAETGRFNQAAATLESAIKLAAAAPPEQLKRMQFALAKYRDFRTIYQ